MSKSIKQQWVEALRSGEYAQGQGFLHYDENGTHTYCCLGVLADVCGVEWKQQGNEHVQWFKHNDLWWDVTVPFDFAGLDLDQNDDNGTSIREALIYYNDDGYTFEEIADWIEENVEG